MDRHAQFVCLCFILSFSPQQRIQTHTNTQNSHMYTRTHKHTHANTYWDTHTNTHEYTLSIVLQAPDQRPSLDAVLKVWLTISNKTKTKKNTPPAALARIFFRMHARTLYHSLTVALSLCISRALVLSVTRSVFFLSLYVYVWRIDAPECALLYGVASISSLRKIIGLFCKRAL